MQQEERERPPPGVSVCGESPVSPRDLSTTLPAFMGDLGAPRDLSTTLQGSKGDPGAPRDLSTTLQGSKGDPGAAQDLSTALPAFMGDLGAPRDLSTTLQGSAGDPGAPRDFSATLPAEMSLEIFCRLDARSLCSASLTCVPWHRLIEGSQQLWRRQCHVFRATCQREVDRDRMDGLSWKVTMVRNYRRSFLKRDWLRGRYSHVRSYEDLMESRMCPLDVESWGEILEAELER